MEHPLVIIVGGNAKEKCPITPLSIEFPPVAGAERMRWSFGFWTLVRSKGMVPVVAVAVSGIMQVEAAQVESHPETRKMGSRKISYRCHIDSRTCCMGDGPSIWGKLSFDILLKWTSLVRLSLRPKALPCHGMSRIEVAWQSVDTVA